MASNLVRNLNKLRAANKSTRPESSVIIFDYFAPESSTGQVDQRPIVRVEAGSLRQLDDGDWLFKGVNLYRVDDKDRGVRTYRVRRINGIARKP